jgi:hypothetical protein
VIRCLNENEANYCTAGYYLLQVDQNYWLLIKCINYEL